MIINGSIENIIYRNEANGFTVLLVKTGKTVFTLTGNISDFNVGETIEANVNEVNHPNFGLQYQILDYKILIPDDNLDAINKFLISLSIKGVGEATVKRMIDNFGTEIIDIIKYSPEKLYGIKGLNENKIKELSEKVITRQNEIEIVIELEKYKLGNMTIKKIIEQYGGNTLDVINNNPYQLAIDIEGIGFNTCDKIAKINGYLDTDGKRIMACIIYILECNMALGNIFVYKEDLINQLIKVLELNGDYNFDDAFYNLSIDLKIKIDKLNNKELVFLKSSYNTEKLLSELLYSKRQDIIIITGGPGTGKTYNIKKYLNESSENGLRVALCAPTGRAAKRITELTGYEAKTIHRLLECIGDDEGKKIYFQKNDQNKLDIDVLIVDEMSMVDEYLMLALIKAVPEYTKIILVGDVDQLPSVGAGQVLKDMIYCNYFTVKRLTKIYRQDEGSKIVINAHKVNEGKDVTFESDATDFIFSHKNTDGRIKETIKVLVKENLPNHFRITNDEIQVICASKKGECGTEALNKTLQSTLNPESFEKDEIKVGDTVFRTGDKVMQTSNNYNIPYDMVSDNGTIYDRGVGVFNGDIGKIVEIDSELRNVVIKFDDKEAYYISKDLNDLSLAYAITVHKSQGSEYDVVVMPMTRAPYQLLNRKILYTAITRAKKCIIFVGMEEYFKEMLNNNNESKRNSALCSKLYLYDI